MVLFPSLFSRPACVVCEFRTLKLYTKHKSWKQGKMNVLNSNPWTEKGSDVSLSVVYLVNTLIMLQNKTWEWLGMRLNVSQMFNKLLCCVS